MPVSSKLSVMFLVLHRGIHLAYLNRESRRRYLNQISVADSKAIDHSQGYRELVKAATRFRDDFSELIPELQSVTVQDIVDDYVKQYSETPYGVSVNEQD